MYRCAALRGCHPMQQMEDSMNGMADSISYFDSAEGVMISQKRALREVIDHGLADEVGTFLDDLGDREEYDAQDVLRWLGY